MTTHCITCRNWNQLDELTGLCKTPPLNTEYPQLEYRFRLEGDKCLSHCPNGLPEPVIRIVEPKPKTAEQLEAERILAIELEYRKSVQNKLVAYFEESGLSRRQLATKIGLSAWSVGVWIKDNPPSMNSCTLILQAIEISKEKQQ